MQEFALYRCFFKKKLFHIIRCIHFISENHMSLNVVGNKHRYML